MAHIPKFEKRTWSNNFLSDFEFAWSFCKQNSYEISVFKSQLSIDRPVSVLIGLIIL